MPCLLQEALPDTPALPYSLGLDLDQVTPSLLQPGGLFVGRVLLLYHHSMARTTWALPHCGGDLWQVCLGLATGKEGLAV